MRIRQIFFGVVLAVAVVWSGVSSAQGVNRPVTRGQADGFFVNIDGDTMTGTLLVPTLDVSLGVLNSGATNNCFSSSGDFCIPDNLDVNGQMKDSRSNSPLTVADIDGFLLTGVTTLFSDVVSGFNSVKFNFDGARLDLGGGAGDYLDSDGTAVRTGSGGLVVAGDFSTSTGVIDSSVPDGTVGLIIDILNSHSTADLLQIREVGGAPRFTVNAAGNVVVAGLLDVNGGFNSNAFVRNNTPSNLCASSSDRHCILDGTDFNGDILDSRLNSPLTVIDVDGLAMTAGDIALTAVDVTCVTANTCNLGSSTSRFNSVFASDLFSDRINARGVGDRVKIVESDGVTISGPIDSDTGAVVIDETLGLTLSAVTTGNDAISFANEGAQLRLGPDAGAFLKANGTDRIDTGGGFLVTGELDVRGTTGIVNFGPNNGGRVHVSDSDGMSTVGDIHTVAWTTFGGSSTIVGWVTPLAGSTLINFKKVGNLVYVQFFLDGVSNSTAVTFTLPHTQISTNGVELKVAIQVGDNNVISTTSGLLVLGPNSNVASCFLDMAGTIWTASGSKRVQGQFWYEAQ